MNEDPRLARYLDQQEIRDVYYHYCRGADRRDFDMMRSCYHADAIDDHGDYVGGVDGFLEFVESSLQRYERTMHFLGNILIDVDGDRARGEAYAIAFHRMLSTPARPERDFVVWFRYVDDFERRDGEWRIAHRICVFDWTRLNLADPNRHRFGETACMGQFGSGDPVFAASLATFERGR